MYNLSIYLTKLIVCVNILVDANVENHKCQFVVIFFMEKHYIYKFLAVFSLVLNLV